MENLEDESGPSRHIFLTGGIQVGKSTAISRYLSAAHPPLAGFRTLWQAQSLLLAPLLPKGTAPLCVARREPGGVRTVPGGFDRAARLLSGQDLRGAALLLMDELGFLEADSPAFQSAILRLLDGPLPVLGVLRQDARGPFWETLHRRADVEIWTVDAENRDAIPARLRGAFCRLFRLDANKNLE